MCVLWRFLFSLTGHTSDVCWQEAEGSAVGGTAADISHVTDVQPEKTQTNKPFPLVPRAVSSLTPGNTHTLRHAQRNTHTHTYAPHITHASEHTPFFLPSFCDAKLHIRACWWCNGPQAGSTSLIVWSDCRNAHITATKRVRRAGQEESYGAMSLSEWSRGKLFGAGRNSEWKRGWGGRKSWRTFLGAIGSVC